MNKEQIEEELTRAIEKIAYKVMEESAYGDISPLQEMSIVDDISSIADMLLEVKEQNLID